MTDTATKPAKGRQAKIPGFTEIQDDEVETLAEAFAQARDDWQAKGVEMAAAKKALMEAAKKNKKIIEAAKANKKGNVKVGDALLTIQAKNPTLNIKVKMFGETQEEADADKAGEPETAEPVAAE